MDYRDYLEHFGVLGMHWGVRKDKTTIKQRIGNQFKSHEERVQAIKKKNEAARRALEPKKAEIPKERKAWDDEHSRIDPIIAKEYGSKIQDIQDLMDKNDSLGAEKKGDELKREVEKRVKELQKPDLSPKYELKPDVMIDMDYGTPYLMLELFDKQTNKVLWTEFVEHSENLEGDDILEHYGVLGMHWGVRKEEKRIAKTTKKAAKATRKEEKRAIKEQRNKVTKDIDTKYATELDKIQKAIRPLYDFDNEDIISQFYKKGQLWDYDTLNSRGKAQIDKINKMCRDLSSKVHEEYGDGSQIKSPNGLYSLRVGDVTWDEDDGGGLGANVNIYDETKKRNTIFMSGTEDEIEEFLAHYGVLGMHWGVRKEENRVKKSKRSKRISSDEHINTRELKKKRLHELTNAELQVLNQRRQLEEQYIKLNPTIITKGSNDVTKLLREVGRELAKEAIKDYIKAPKT